MISFFDRDLIAQCQINAPRYTSYPTADRFNVNYTVGHHVQHIPKVFNTYPQHQPVSLYIHIPFCNKLCLFCACNKIITNDRSNIQKYLNYLDKELDLYANLIAKKLDVVQLHFGGGSPSWMSVDEVSHVMNSIKKYFNLNTAKEVSMEIDPRHVGYDFIQGLKQNGFNRISIGVQDFNPKVQKTVNRVQSFEASQIVLQAAKELGFHSTNVDLIYGLPFQTLESFNLTIDKLIELNPDRVALFNYAHIPEMFLPQTRIQISDLPSPETKLDILSMSVTKLSEHGYKFIGMDHFALPNDELAIALSNGTLQRNFQGYSTFADTDMLSFGVSSIGLVNHEYYQNLKDLSEYYASLDKNVLPIFRGIVLTHDDQCRKYIINCIMCQYSLCYNDVEQRFNVNFSQYFSKEIIQLTSLEAMGLIKFNSRGFNITDVGRFLIRNVAVIFDQYFARHDNTGHYSKVI